MSLTKKKKKSNKSENLSGFLFILPQTVGILIFSLIPMIFSLYLSFTSWDFLSGFNNIKWIGIKNYKDLWTDVWFTDSLKNTLIFSFSTVLLEITLGIIIAFLLIKYVFCSDFFKTIFFIPYISSIIALAVVFMAMLHPTKGPVNAFLSSIGVQNLPGWFGDPKWAMVSIIALTVWKELGYFILVYIAGLKAVPNELYEAADIDGAGVFRKFRSITIPMVSPTTFFLVIMGIIGSFKAFDQITVTTEGGPGTATTVLVYYIYKAAFQFFKMGYASAMAWVLVVMIFIITAVQWIYQKKWVSYD